MKTLSLIFWSILSVNAFSQCADTNNIYKFTYLGKNYEIVKEQKSWKDAAACAVERGGYLLQIEDSLKQLKVYDEILNGANISTTYTSVTNGGAIAYIWIGATDQATEGDWLWDNNDNGSGSKFWSGGNTGSSVNNAFQNWGGKLKSSQNEPDNFGTGQDFAAIGLAGWPARTTLLGSPGEWNDISGTSSIYFIIEYDSVKVPADTTSSSILVHSNTGFKPYPNPAKDRIYIASNKSISAYLINIDGKKVGTFKENELDVSELARGTYWINIREDSKIFRYPIVIE